MQDLQDKARIAAEEEVKAKQERARWLLAEQDHAAKMAKAAKE